jgi:hypothetical protein
VSIEDITIKGNYTDISGQFTSIVTLRVESRDIILLGDLVMTQCNNPIIMCTFLQIKFGHEIHWVSA